MVLSCSDRGFGLGHRPTQAGSDSGAKFTATGGRAGVVIHTNRGRAVANRAAKPRKASFPRLLIGALVAAVGKVEAVGLILIFTEMLEFKPQHVGLVVM